MHLRDKVELVTGASRGIGRAMALRLADEGADLVVWARSSEEVLDAVVYVASDESQGITGQRFEAQEFHWPNRWPVAEQLSNVRR